MPHYVAMNLNRRWITLGIAFAIGAVMGAPFAGGQEVMVPVPGQDYSNPRAGGPYTSEPLPSVVSPTESDPSAFAVPIPGGGDISVQGPASEDATHLPPTENWSTRQITPHSPGGGPIGP